MEKLVQCQQTRPVEITMAFRDKMGPATRTYHCRGGIDLA